MSFSQLRIPKVISSSDGRRFLKNRKRLILRKRFGYSNVMFRWQSTSVLHCRFRHKMHFTITYNSSFRKDEKNDLHWLKIVFISGISYDLWPRWYNSKIGDWQRIRLSNARLPSVAAAPSAVFDSSWPWRGRHLLSLLQLAVSFSVLNAQLKIGNSRISCQEQAFIRATCIQSLLRNIGRLPGDESLQLSYPLFTG